MEFIEMIKNWANDPYITHDDYTKCGQCWREKIKSEVCTNYINKYDRADQDDLKWILDYSKEKWQETSLYKRVREMLAQGKTIVEIDEELRSEGIEI